MKQQDGDWFVGNKLWNVLTPDQRKLILFQHYKHQNPTKSENNQTTQNQRQSSNYVHKKDQSQIPPNLKISDAIVKPPKKKEGS